MDPQQPQPQQQQQPPPPPPRARPAQPAGAVVDAAGVLVRFPHTPYAAQAALMRTVVAALQRGEHALVESPTGTGKTLSLLCAALAWRDAVARWRAEALAAAPPLGARAPPPPPAARARLDALARAAFAAPHAAAVAAAPPAPPQLLYASRTHSQLAQVAAELRACGYAAVACVLGSRDQMCISHPVMAAPAPLRSGICRAKVIKKQCAFHAAAQDSAIQAAVAAQIMDIEDLVAFGKQKAACPYYISSNSLPTADVVLLPYNYLIEPTARKSQNINLKNAIVIFDEAHNLEASCNEATSAEISSDELAHAIREVEIAVSVFTAVDYRPSRETADLTEDDLSFLKDKLARFAEKLAAVQLNRNTRDLVESSVFLFALLDDIGIGLDNQAYLTKVINSCVDLLTHDHKRAKIKNMVHLRRLSNLIATAFKALSEGDTPLSHYKVYIKAQDPLENIAQSRRSSMPKLPLNITLSFWCFSSSVAMQELVRLGARSIILASGTLSPLSSFAEELGIPFAHVLENPHVIDSSQIFVNVVPVGPKNVRLSSSYKNKSSPDYFPELGRCIVETARVVPDGVLVFFTSYSRLVEAIEVWKRKSSQSPVSIWDQLTAIKQPVIEPRNKHEFNRAIQDFECKLDDASGRPPIFFAVCRGKASEGIDFSDRKARAVIICGIPYPAFQDPRVKLKQEVLNEAAPDGSKTRGMAWYSQQASRAVNQAIGRVIRHRKDYGAILLCDERFSYDRVIQELPKWVRSQVQKPKTFADSITGLQSFFGNVGKSTSSALAPSSQQDPGVLYDDATALSSSGKLVPVTQVHSSPVDPLQVGSAADRPSKRPSDDPLADPSKFRKVPWLPPQSHSFHQTVEQKLASVSYPRRPATDGMLRRTLDADGGLLARSGNVFDSRFSAHSFGIVGAEPLLRPAVFFEPQPVRQTEPALPPAAAMNAVSKPALTKPPTTNLDPADYLKRIRDVSTPTQFSAFKKHLSKYRAREIPIETLISFAAGFFVEQLSAAHPMDRCMLLARGFRHFIGRKHVDAFDLEVDTRRAIVAGSIRTRS
ncbi:hypothetical protein HK105_204765 [Polyrhizophydium stewartii]|uniref:DNA 5'-3' helicase n=1 Tax=Polyrhizophydium stewartii TaxID=2732419 RepID=A0ABR4N7S6_9FUNG